MSRQIRLFAALVLVLAFGSALAQTQRVTTPGNKPAVNKVSGPTVTNPGNDTGSPPSPYHEDEVRTGLRLNDPSYSSSSKSAPPPVFESDPTLAHEIFEDFLNGTSFTPLEKINQLAAAGGGTGQAWLAGPVYEDAWGVIEAQHGTGTFSRLDLVGKSHNMYRTAVGIGTAYEYQVRFNFANLSNETNRYVTFDGFFDGDTVDPEFNRGILFRYSDNINDGRFQAVVREMSGVETLVDTGVIAETGTWYRLKITITASGDEAVFSINDKVVATVTTNLAIGPANRYTAESNTDRMSGNTPFVSRRFDYVRFRATSGRRSRL